MSSSLSKKPFLKVTGAFILAGMLAIPAVADARPPATGAPAGPKDGLNQDKVLDAFTDLPLTFVENKAGVHGNVLLRRLDAFRRGLPPGH